MLDDNFGDELTLAEDELIERYLDGELAEMRAELAVTDARLDHARSITAAYEERTGATEPA
jgi:hypothetical protein